MAIGTDSTIDFFGTEDEISNTPASVASDGFSVTGDVTDWTNDDDAPFAMFKLKLTAAGLNSAPTAGSVVNLFARHMDINTTEDTPLVDANYPHFYLGSFPVDAADADQVHVIGPIRLPNYETSQVYEFFIENKMNVGTGTGWQLWVTPITYGPHP